MSDMKKNLGDRKDPKKSDAQRLEDKDLDSVVGGGGGDVPICPPKRPVVGPLAD